ncbi:citrate synthase [bacterium]|nr:citrate synthase [bacterium]
MGSQEKPVEKIVVRGLEGVVAAETSISYVDGVHGRLYYQGYDIHDIAEQISFIECIFLLWNGRLPNRRECDEMRNAIVGEMKLPDAVLELLKASPEKSHPMAVLRTAVSLLSCFDPDADDTTPSANYRKAKRLAGQIPTIIAHLHRLRNGLPLLTPRPELGLSANFLHMLTGNIPDELEKRAMDILMILHADHGLNASTFAARVICSTLSDMHSAVTGAIGALKGPLHGGANEKVMGMLHEINHIDRIQEYIEGMLENKKRIMGFGHRVYRTEDPRAKHLRKYSELLCEKTSQKHLFEMSHRIEKIVFEQKGIYPNVDFYSATVQHALGIPAAYFTTIFVASRTPGWLAHIIEQYSDNRLIRPTSKYTGEMGIPFVPLGKRG